MEILGAPVRTRTARPNEVPAVSTRLNRGKTCRGGRWVENPRPFGESVQPLLQVARL